MASAIINHSRCPDCRDWKNCDYAYGWKECSLLRIANALERIVEKLEENKGEV